MLSIIWTSEIFVNCAIFLCYDFVYIFWHNHGYSCYLLICRVLVKIVVVRNGYGVNMKLNLTLRYCWICPCWDWIGFVHHCDESLPMIIDTFLCCVGEKVKIYRLCLYHCMRMWEWSPQYSPVTNGCVFNIRHIRNIFSLNYFQLFHLWTCYTLDSVNGSFHPVQ